MAESLKQLRNQKTFFLIFYSTSLPSKSSIVVMQLTTKNLESLKKVFGENISSTPEDHKMLSEN